MKIFMILILFSSIIYSEDLPIMLKIKSKVKLTNDFRNGVESVLSKHGYTLVDQTQQDEVLRAQGGGSPDGCLDDSCLIDTGKMLAAKELFFVEVNFKASHKYSFNIRVMDLETDSIIKTETMFYNDSLTNSMELFEFAKELTNRVLSLNTQRYGYMIPIFFSDLTISPFTNSKKIFLAANSGIGFKLIKSKLFDFSTFELNFKFYRAITDSYFYSDIELQYKLNFLKEKLFIGLTLPFRILFNESVEGNMGIMPGLLFEYNIFSKDGFFIDIEFSPFYAISFKKDVDKALFFKTGVNIGWILF